jgi:hypothetical protein
MVKWTALTVSDTFEGYTDDGSWRELGKRLGDEWHHTIVSLSLSGANAGATIDSNADGYYIGNKVIAIFPFTQQIDLCGIGYWKKHENVVRIKWYRKDTMELVFTEAKPTNECEGFLIKNAVHRN